MHKVSKQGVRKLLEIENEPVLIEISENEAGLKVEVLFGKGPEEPIVQFVEEWLDMSRNIEPFYELLKKDKELAYMTTDFYGLRMIAIPDLFEALCWSIIGQQINLPFAYKLKRRLTETYGKMLTYEGAEYYLFPKPEDLLRIAAEDLLPMQFSGKKAEYIIEIAGKFANGQVSKEILQNLSTQEAIAHLVKIRGIGEWTANYAMMKSLKRLECITYGDVGLYNALAQQKGFPKRPSKEELNIFFAGFKNWEAYTVFYLWRTLALKKQ